MHKRDPGNLPVDTENGKYLKNKQESGKNRQISDLHFRNLPNFDRTGKQH